MEILSPEEFFRRFGKPETWRPLGEGEAKRVEAHTCDGITYCETCGALPGERDGETTNERED